MYNQNNLLPLKVVSKTSIKNELQCVAFYGNRTIATDSFRLMEVSSVGESEAHEPKLIHHTDLKAVKLKKDERIDLPLLELKADAPAKSEFYPDVDKILNENDTVEYAKVKVDGKLLGETLIAMAKMNVFHQVELRVPINTANKPIRLFAHNHKAGDNRQEARGLVMPQNK